MCKDVGYCSLELERVARGAMAYLVINIDDGVVTGTRHCKAGYLSYYSFKRIKRTARLQLMNVFGENEQQ